MRSNDTIMHSDENTFNWADWIIFKIYWYFNFMDVSRNIGNINKISIDIFTKISISYKLLKTHEKYLKNSFFLPFKL